MGHWWGTQKLQMAQIDGKGKQALLCYSVYVSMKTKSLAQTNPTSKTRPCGRPHFAFGADICGVEGIKAPTGQRIAIPRRRPKRFIRRPK